MKVRRAVTLLIILALLFGLPLCGIYLGGKSVSLYLEFPPVTQYVVHEPFLWGAFVLIAIFTLSFVSPYLLYGIKKFIHHQWTLDRPAPPKASFPGWGYLGIILMISSWIIAWNRFDLFSSVQLHTFTPLWIGYIVTVNALTYRRKQNCSLLKPAKFFLLFAVSAVFWWFFEYLNRFVQNWSYKNVSQFTEWEYFLLASLSFSTVLPAVLGTMELLETYSFWRAGFLDYQSIKKLLNIADSKVWMSFILMCSSATLLLVGLHPNYLFPFIWIAPLLIILSVHGLINHQTVSHGLSSSIVTAAMASLICGFFWEMWNFYSEAKWIYSIPFVNRFHVFEMPVLGFAGYIPFGLACLALWNVFFTDDAHTH